jgi:hypothetical protein
MRWQRMSRVAARLGDENGDIEARGPQTAVGAPQRRAPTVATTP